MNSGTATFSAYALPLPPRSTSTVPLAWNADTLLEGEGVTVGVAVEDDDPVRDAVTEEDGVLDGVLVDSGVKRADTLADADDVPLLLGVTEYGVAEAENDVDDVSVLVRVASGLAGKMSPLTGGRVTP